MREFSGVHSGSFGSPCRCRLYHRCPIRGSHCDTNSGGDELRTRCAPTAPISRHGVVSRRPRTCGWPSCAGLHEFLGCLAVPLGQQARHPREDSRRFTAITKRSFGSQALLLQPLQYCGVSLFPLSHEELVLSNATPGWGEQARQTLLTSEIGTKRWCLGVSAMWSLLRGRGGHGVINRQTDGNDHNRRAGAKLFDAQLCRLRVRGEAP